MTDPMAGFPPPPEAQVSLANWRTAPFNRWAFHHVREIVPSADIPHDPCRVAPLADGEALAWPAIDGAPDLTDPGAFMAATHTDALVVLRHGKIVLERYRAPMTDTDPHILMSVSKSMLGLLAGILAGSGDLDTDAPAERYVPELGPTAFAGATVRQLLDMRSGLAWDEDYATADGPIIQYRKSTLWNPLEPGEAPLDLRSFLSSLTERAGPHGGPFAYISPCTDLLAWVLERASGTRYADLFSELIWTKIGAEAPAYITVDRFGAPRAAGGMCMRARDLARVGLMVAEGGRGIVPEAWLADIATGGDKDAWGRGSFAADYGGRDMHYRAKWYVFRGPSPSLGCSGIHGQNLYVHADSGLVVARFSSAPDASDPTGERLGLRLFEAIRAAVG